MIVSWYTSKNESLTKGIFHYEQALALKKNCGIDVAIYYPFDENIKNDFEKEITDDHIVVYRSSYRRSLITRWRQYANAYKAIKSDFDFDIIHCQCAFQAGLVALFYKKKYGVRYCLTEHCPPQAMMLCMPFMHLLLDKIYENSYMLTTVSPYMQIELNRIFRKKTFQTIYNGVSIAEITSNYNFNNDNWNVAIASLFYSKTIKGYQYLLPAIAKFNEQSDKKIMLHIIGDGVYKEYYQEFARKLGLGSYIFFYGQLKKNDLYGIMRKMDFCVSASIFESAGVFIEESMMLGKPVLVTESGGGNSLVNDRTAIVVEKESVEALYRGLIKIINQIESYSEDYIKNYAYKNFSMAATTKSYEQIYNM